MMNSSQKIFNKIINLTKVKKGIFKINSKDIKKGFFSINEKCQIPI